MENKYFYKIKMILVEKHRTSKWVSEHLDNDLAIV